MEKKIKDEYNECEDDFCDFDPNKICDNCEKCLGLDKEYNEVKISKIIVEDKKPK